MAYGVIEPTGCVVRKGKVQLRFSFYLEPSDARYGEHHIQVPIIPEGGYPGEVDAEGSPVNQGDYNNWIESLPKQWQNNPFHNHFVYVDANVMDDEISRLLAESLDEFYGIWARGEDILKVWKPKEPFAAGDMSGKNKQKCQRKVEDIVGRVQEFQAVHREKK